MHHSELHAPSELHAIFAADFPGLVLSELLIAGSLQIAGGFDRFEFVQFGCGVKYDIFQLVTTSHPLVHIQICFYQRYRTAKIKGLFRAYIPSAHSHLTSRLKVEVRDRLT